MTWGEPAFIYVGILLAVLVFGAGVLAWFRRTKVLGLFVSAERVDDLTAGMPGWEYWLRTSLIAGAVVLAGAALAGPRWGVVMQKSNANSLDVLMAVDTSRSMMAEDLAPNRMTRTRLAIQELLELGEGDRFGLIPFAGSAFLQCPLTVDQEALRQHVNLVNVDVIPEGGTKIGEAIGEAMKAFAKHQQESHKVLVLFSDGEDHDDEAVEKAREAAGQGMKIFTIGTGTTGGELIPVVNCKSCDAPNVPGKTRCHECDAYLPRNHEFMRDEDGKIVRSKLNESMLEEIAEVTGGFYLPLGGARTMQTLHKNGLAPLPKSGNNTTMVPRQIERFQWPLAGAIALLLMELLWPAGRRRPVGAVAALLAGLLLLPMEGLAASQSHAAKNYRDGEFALALVEYEELLKASPGDPKLHYNAGASAYRAGKHGEAAKHFKAALRTRDLTLQQRAFYNLGNNHFRQGQPMPRPEDQIGEWEQSAKMFEAALQLNRRDADARRNLKFVREQIRLAKAKLEQLSDEVPLDGVTRFKNQEEKKIGLRVFPPQREMIGERPYWRMFAYDEYAQGVAAVSDSLLKLARSANGPLASDYGGQAPVENAKPGVWRFRFEPLFSKFLPFNGPFAKAEVTSGAWHYNAEVFHGRLPDVPSKAVNYLLTDPAGNERLAGTAHDQPLKARLRGEFILHDPKTYPHTTLHVELKPAEKAKLAEVVQTLTEEKDLPVEDFTKRTIAWLHQNHQYTRQTRIPEDDQADPVLRWMLSKEKGHCEYFAYSYVLLARAAGHPARIVCGFAGGKWDNKTQSWVNEITDAHAWAEVFDGTHWVRVEATPPEDGNGEGENQQQQQPNQNQGQGNPNDPNQQNDPQNPNQQQGDQPPPDEDRDEGELPKELLETLRQAERLLDALKGDEKPLSAIEDKKGRRGLFKRRPKKNW